MKLIKEFSTEIRVHFYLDERRLDVQTSYRFNGIAPLGGVDTLYLPQGGDSCMAKIISIAFMPEKGLYVVQATCDLDSDEDEDELLNGAPVWHAAGWEWVIN